MSLENHEARIQKLEADILAMQIVFLKRAELQESANSYVMSILGQVLKNQASEFHGLTKVILKTETSIHQILKIIIGKLPPDKDTQVLVDLLFSSESKVDQLEAHINDAEKNALDRFEKIMNTKPAPPEVPPPLPPGA